MMEAPGKRDLRSFQDARSAAEPGRRVVTLLKSIVEFRKMLITVTELNCLTNCE